MWTKNDFYGDVSDEPLTSDEEEEVPPVMRKPKRRYDKVKAAETRFRNAQLRAEGKPVPEITTACWDILDVIPDAMMCASSRMVVKCKGDSTPSVMACTLLAYDQQFNLGSTLAEASKTVQLNHPHCAAFCVLGGGSCSVEG